MKKVKKTLESPSLLASYLSKHPDNTWPNFKNEEQTGHGEVKDQLIIDQRGLCAYCEIDLKLAYGQALDDFRVEHFYPKKPHNPPPNHALDWNNLLGVCHGGQNSNVIESALRHSKGDYSCDVPKGNKNWVDTILNPLTDIPAFPRLFQYLSRSDNGKIEVDLKLCPQELQAQAEESINKLKLNSVRLKRLRSAVIDQLNTQFTQLVSEGFSDDDALEELAIVNLNQSAGGHWPAMFTCIRWYLADVAEVHL